jgi:TM2 domain-containing membrane protein YozV
MREKSLPVAYILWFFLGFLGVHKFYLEKIFIGILYILTGGLFFIGWFIDLFTLPSQVDLYNLRMLNLYSSNQLKQRPEPDKMDEMMAKARGIEERLQNVEDIVTSKEFDFFRKLHRKH